MQSMKLANVCASGLLGDERLAAMFTLAGKKKTNKYGCENVRGNGMLTIS
jgi:hypothetical protein